MRREIQCDSPWPRDQLLQLMKVGDFGTKEILLRNVAWPTIPWTVIPLHVEESEVRSLTALLQTSGSSALLEGLFRRTSSLVSTYFIFPTDMGLTKSCPPLVTTAGLEAAT